MYLCRFRLEVFFKFLVSITVTELICYTVEVGPVPLCWAALMGGFLASVAAIIIFAVKASRTRSAFLALYESKNVASDFEFLFQRSHAIQ